MWEGTMDEDTHRLPAPEPGQSASGANRRNHTFDAKKPPRTRPPQPSGDSALRATNPPEPPQRADGRARWIDQIEQVPTTPIGPRAYDGERHTSNGSASPSQTDGAAGGGDSANS